MYRPDLTLLIAFGSSLFLRFGFCYDESPWQPSYDYYHIDLGELGGHHGGNHEGSGVKIPVPKDVMVDVINDLGIKLLAIHNERNDNNIAISPYGALSVLAALSEGLQGDAVHEILHSAHIPKDRHVIRVGLRDIHRHLKSYFIPEEGFLAGLTLNLNNVTLRGEYEDVLRFYGFDYGSFNNALYPEPLTTNKPSESSTLGITLGLTEGLTTETIQEIKDTTIILADTRFGGLTTETTTTQDITGKEISTSSMSTTIEGKEETTIGMKEETTTIETSAATTSISPSTQQETTTSREPETTTTQSIATKVPETTTIAIQETTVNDLPQTSATSAETATEMLTTTTLLQSNTETLTTSKDEPKINTETPATETVSISSKISKVTAKISESSFEYSEISTYLLETTTAMPTTEIPMTTEGLTTVAKETTTPKVTTITTNAPGSTTNLLTITTEPQQTTTDTTDTTAVPTTVISETTTTFPSTTTVLSAPTIMTQKTSDTQRTTRQISASMIPSDLLSTTPAGETTASFGRTTLSVEETTVSVDETTVSVEKTTMPREEITMIIGERKEVTSVSVTETVEETTVSAMETVEETTVSAMETVEKTTVSATEAVEETTISAMETVEETTVSAMETVEETTVSATETVDETTVSPQTSTMSNLGTTMSNEVTTLEADTNTLLSREVTTMAFVENTIVPLVNLETSFGGTDVQNDLLNSRDENTQMPFVDESLEDVETTTPFFFETTTDFQDTTFIQDNFDYNYNYESNSPFNNNSGVELVPSVYDDNAANLVNNNLMPDKPEGASFNRNLRRRARSVADYVIARYYDDHQYPYVAPPPRTIYPAQQEPPQRPPYAPQRNRPQYLPQPDAQRRTPYIPQQEPLTFAVYGKYRESGINFMKYDTVLPFFFVPNLKALALSFPLDSSKYYLLLLLPVEENGVDQLICDLRLHGNLKYIIEHLSLTHVVATIPSFMLKGYVTLTPLLQRLGIRRIFEPRQADFSPMTNVTDIYVTNIEQAVTVTIRNYLDPSAQHYKNFRQYSPVQFKADHPFLYFVIDSDLQVALMVGKVINPLNSRIR